MHSLGPVFGQSAGGLVDQPVRVLIELARHLNLHPADLVTALDPLLEYDRDGSAADDRGDRDTRVVFAALATARGRLTRDDLADVFGWPLDGAAGALEDVAAKPGPRRTARAAPGAAGRPHPRPAARH